ncbi:MAG: hypothetical protein ACMXYE_04360 [Candidatus Woesearchaeota archaeon]
MCDKLEEKVDDALKEQTESELKVINIVEPTKSPNTELKKQSEKDRRSIFEETVINKCIYVTQSGIKVQSRGEQMIADFLFKHKIDFDYDEQMTFRFNEKNAQGYYKEWKRPDFYLTEFCIIIEYWGLKGTPDYDLEMERKKRIYKEANQKFISITPDDLNNLDEKLTTKLNRLGVKIEEVLKNNPIKNRKIDEHFTNDYMKITNSERETKKRPPSKKEIRKKSTSLSKNTKKNTTKKPKHYSKSKKSGRKSTSARTNRRSSSKTNRSRKGYR